MNAAIDGNFVARWAAAHPLRPAHVDCATAVMLKILDGKCKMAETMISRPVMKGFKALIREQGLFAGLATSAKEE